MLADNCYFMQYGSKGSTDTLKSKQTKNEIFT